MYTGFAIPRLRVRQNVAGTLDTLPAPDLPPWEASESWWQGVLANHTPVGARKRYPVDRQRFHLQKHHS
jgi:hypothetical protein